MNVKANNHLCRLSASIKEYYDPIFSNLGITYTHQTRVYNNGKSFLLTNNPQYLEFFLEKKYALPEPGIYTKSGIHLWSGIIGLQNYDSQVIDMKMNFNVDHQIAIVYVEHNYTDIFALGTTSQRPEMVNYYLNNQDSFDNIFLTYKDKFKYELMHLEQNPLSIPLRPKDFIKRNQILKNFSNITIRELQCLELLARGQTAKTIAKKLVISHRTVERHIDNIREKLDSKCKIEIVNKYREYAFVNANITPIKNHDHTT